MTANELLMTARRTGIVLEARGGRLVVDAPTGAVTPELRNELVRLKPALLMLLAPPRAFVTLKNGPTLPVEAIELALDLEHRGFRLSIDADQQFQIEPSYMLTEADHAGIHRWRWHLGAIVAYEAPVLA